MTDPDKNADINDANRDKPPSTAPEAGAAKPPKDAAPKPARKRRWPKVLISLLIAVLILFGAGVAAGLYFLPEIRERAPFLTGWLPEASPQASNESDEVIALQDRLARLEHQLRTLDRTTGEHGEKIARLETEDTRLATGIARVEALMQDIETAPAPRPEAAEIEEPAPTTPETGPASAPRPPAERDDGQLAARLDMMLLRLGQLETSFIPLSEKVNRQADAGEDRAAIKARTETIEDRVNALNSRLDRLESAAAADARQAVLVLTYAAARRAADAGRAFSNEYEALRSMAQDARRDSLKPAIDRLSALAERGAPTVADLRDRLPDTVTGILEAARLPANPNWWDRLLAQIKGVITLRRTDRLDGDGVAAIVARAESRMALGDLEGAVDALERLEGNAARAAADWIAMARDRLALEDRLARVEDRLRAMTPEPPEADRSRVDPSNDPADNEREN